MKKILIVSGIQVFPPQSGGQLRTANIARALATMGFQIKIYSFTGRKADYLNRKKSGNLAISEKLCEYVNLLPFLGFIQFIFYRLNLPPLWLTWLTQLWIPTSLKEELKNSDVLILDFPYLYPIYKHTLLPIMVNTHNAEFELYGHNKILTKVVRNIEIKCFKKASSLFFCNKDDQKKFIQELPELSKKSHYLPNGVNISDFILDTEARNAIRNKYKISDNATVFLFTGSSFSPNKKACEFLIKWCADIKNSQALSSANIIILIAGTVCETPISTPHLKIVGKVPQMLPYFSACDFGLNPVLTGSGTNVKMMEFLAAKKPILTTEFGARGLELTDQTTCFYFSESNLLTVLISAANTTAEARIKIGEKAYIQNQKHIDMLYALKSLNIAW